MDAGASGESPKPPGPTTKFGIDGRKLLRIALGMAIGAVGASIFYKFSLPLPWFLGSLTFCLIAAVIGVPYDQPRLLANPMRAVLGVAIGTAFTPDLLTRIGPMSLSLALIVPYMIVIIIIGWLYFERVAKFDRPTAFFSAVPGGLTDMVVMAADAGADTRRVALVQATRIIMIVFLLPFWLQWHDGQQIGVSSISRVHLWEIPLIDILAMIAMGWFGAWAAMRAGLAGAALVGPMIVSGVAHALGFTASRMPFEVLTLAQITLGVMLGLRFRGVTMREFTTTLVWGILFAIVLVSITAVVATYISQWSGFDSVSVLLAYAPGGQTELNLLAYILGLDVAFVALHHLVRLAIVILGTQLVFAAGKSWRSRRDK